jgi:ArsR family transcriptional regulator
MNDLEILSILFKTLANPNRLKIFDILMTGVHCNCEIAKLTGLSLNLISHHLNALSGANLVVSERNKDDARWIYYSVNEETILSSKLILQTFFENNRIQNRIPSCPPCNN